jgi:hypothetical protein
MDEMGESRLRALAIAVQVLEELPDELRPDSNIDDMREMLAGKSTGRDWLILTQAVATALAFRAMNAMRVSRDYSNPEHALAGLNNRNQEFSALFELVGQCNAPLLSLYFDQACGNLATAATGEQG